MEKEEQEAKTWHPSDAPLLGNIIGDRIPTRRGANAWPRVVLLGKRKF
jgi:hypothetical protein